MRRFVLNWVVAIVVVVMLELGVVEKIVKKILSPLRSRTR